MPITYRVDHDRRVVLAVAHGMLTMENLFTYQQELASLPGATSYDELVDMTPVTHIEDSPGPRARDLASFAASTDHPTLRSRFAIVAPSALSFGLGRMYASLRESDRRSTKEVGVFRTMEEARAFLGLQEPLELPDWTAG